ncbi:LicD family protein [uncultured Fibrobacter sp.]|uniref:LicD family protein n=1 Tax=uncultured Fibrobacter sp. TaxID=261512 RepID=UPI002804989E|nr:LicD family protein [uncultured Fibrobacter sp.]
MNNSLRRLQLKELELLKSFQKICAEQSFSYFALGGTLLGAVRHKGFIPWDDDIDIGIPREDYERFLDYCQNHEVPFELHTFRNDDSYYRYFSHIEDPSVKIRRRDKTIEEVSSAWIDIFPLDGMPNNKFFRAVHKYHILYRRAMYRLSCFSRVVDVNKKNRPLYEKLLVKIGQIFPVEKILHVGKELRKLDRVLKKYPYRKSFYLVNAMGAYKFREMFHKKIYGEGKMYPFEDTEIRGPVDYDFVCTQLYSDYMTPPRQEERNHHQSVMVDEPE